MNDLIEYFSDKEELLLSYVILFAALIVVAVLYCVIKAVVGRKIEKRAETADRAMEKVDLEGYALKIVEENGRYFAALLSGEKTLVTSKEYESVAGVKSALKSMKSNILSDNFTVCAKSGRFFVRLYSSVKPIYESEAFLTREEAEENIALIKKAAANAAE